MRLVLSLPSKGPSQLRLQLIYKYDQLIWILGMDFGDQLLINLKEGEEEEYH